MMPPTIKSAYLQTSRSFPEDASELEPVLSKMYIEVAQAVNLRIIGVFDKFQVVTGERWFNDNDPQSKRQTYRQVYTFGAIAAGVTQDIPHGLTGVTFFTKIYGVANTDFAAVDFRPIPYASATDVLKQISIKVDDVDITINNGANAPNIISLIVVLEYLLN